MGDDRGVTGKGIDKKNCGCNGYHDSSRGRERCVHGVAIARIC